jgi:hypothetical protein
MGSSDGFRITPDQKYLDFVAALRNRVRDLSKSKINESDSGPPQKTLFLKLEDLGCVTQVVFPPDKGVKEMTTEKVTDIESMPKYSKGSFLIEIAVQEYESGDRKFCLYHNRVLAAKIEHREPLPSINFSKVFKEMIDSDSD